MTPHLAPGFENKIALKRVSEFFRHSQLRVPPLLCPRARTGCFAWERKVQVALPSHLSRTGRTFSIIPQSKSQTSPRWGTILLPFEHGGESIPCQSHFLVVERTGIEWRETTEDFLCDGLFLFGRQRLKGGDHFFGDCAHAGNLALGSRVVTSKSQWAGGCVIGLQR